MFSSLRYTKIELISRKRYRLECADTFLYDLLLRAVPALHAVLVGGIYIDPSIALQVMRPHQPTKPHSFALVVQSYDTVLTQSFVQVVQKGLRLKLMRQVAS